MSAADVDGVLGRLIALLASRARTARRLRAALPIVVATSALAWLAIKNVLEKTGGVPALPLDDAYIHLQFARSIAKGTPLVYSPGCGAVAGATSLLWPALLAIGYALGLRGNALVWQSYLFGFAALALLACEARRAIERIVSPESARFAAPLVLAFGANTWFAASGMEVVPLAWLMLGAVRRAAEWHERDVALTQRRKRLSALIAFALAAAWMRPEGAWAALLVAAVIAGTPRGKLRWCAAIPLFGCALPALVNRALTGDFASTTARSKWLVLGPYASASSITHAFAGYLDTLLSTLLNGDVWSAIFLPHGSAPILLAGLVALPIQGFRRRASLRALLLSALALGILFPGTYDCPLCNRLRYLWPFFPQFLLGLLALAELVGEELGRRAPALGRVHWWFLGLCSGALLAYLPFALDDLGTSARAIYRQQVSLGVWANHELPPDANIGLNDTGAIAFFSERKVFDVVGLTTAGEARYWAAGAGSRFEHYERLGARALPTHFIVYPEWFAIPDLLGKELSERFVPGATILGGERMVAYVADYALLGSGESPARDLLAGRRVIDRLDVADLESEHAHGYVLFDANQQKNLVVRWADRLDGARSERSLDRFTLETATNGALVARLAAEQATELTLSVDDQELSFSLPASPWHEALLELPRSIAAGQHRISIASRAGTFSSLHYFSLGPRG